MKSADIAKPATSDVQHPSLLWPSILAALAFLLLAGLGVWQVERLSWKEGVLAQIDARSRQAPFPAPPEAEWPSLAPDDYEYRRVAVKGSFEHDHEALIFRPTGHIKGRPDGPGYHVLTPLRLADGSRIIVNRGFVPLDRQEAATRLDGQIREPVTVTGLMRAPESRNLFTPADNAVKRIWYTRDTASIARDLGLQRVAPFAIDADDAGLPGSLPLGGATLINVPNNHLSYALTWFGLALTLAAFFGIFVWRRKRD